MALYDLIVYRTDVSIGEAARLEFVALVQERLADGWSIIGSPTMAFRNDGAIFLVQSIGKIVESGGE